MNLLTNPSSLSRSYSTFPLCSGDTTLIEIAVYQNVPQIYHNEKFPAGLGIYSYSRKFKGGVHARFDSPGHGINSKTSLDWVYPILEYPLVPSPPYEVRTVLYNIQWRL